MAPCQAGISSDQRSAPMSGGKSAARAPCSACVCVGASASCSVLTSRDGSLVELGGTYAGVRIVTWQAFVKEMQERGWIP